jgi:hypothetical protein
MQRLYRIYLVQLLIEFVLVLESIYSNITRKYKNSTFHPKVEFLIFAVGFD